MIRKAKLPDIEDAADIWLEANIKAHDFIPADYWEAQFKTVKELLAQAELYVYEGDGQENREKQAAVQVRSRTQWCRYRKRSG